MSAIVFCSNPRCKRHVLCDISCDKMVEEDIEGSYKEMMLKMLIDPSVAIMKKKVVYRHKWVDPRIWDSAFWLCDDCNNLAKFLQEKVVKK